MVKIRRTTVDKADKLVLCHKLWGYESYNKEVYAQIAYDEECFVVKFTVGESNPLCEKCNHFESVCKDSCVEFFVNFTPKTSDKYINFEVNAIGTVDAAFRRNRYESVRLSLEEIEDLAVVTAIEEEYWTVTYKIKYDFIKKYYPDFNIEYCDFIVGNLYKCGDETEVKHYLSYFMVETQLPDYHRPEYFGKFILEHEQ